MLSVISIPSWFPSLPVTSTQLLLGGGVLLFFVGLMIGIGRKQRVAVQRSLVTDELMIYLSRIADAMERRAERPSAQQIAEMIERRIAEEHRSAEMPAATTKARAMPFSMFGREYPEKS